MLYIIKTKTNSHHNFSVSKVVSYDYLTQQPKTHILRLLDGW